MVRNSCVSEREVVLIFLPVAASVEVLVAELEDLLTPEFWRVRTGVKLAEGLVPGACWMSLPCSAISAGPILRRWVRSWGVIDFRTRALAGSFAFVAEWISMSNCIPSSLVVGPP